MIGYQYIRGGPPCPPVKGKQLFFAAGFVIRPIAKVDDIAEWCHLRPVCINEDEDDDVAKYWYRGFAQRRKKYDV